MQFQDLHGIIVIEYEGRQFTCATKQFLQFEPEYQHVPEGYIGRIWTRVWTAHRACLKTTDSDVGDPFYTPERLASYMSKLDDYSRRLAAATYTNTRRDALDDQTYLTKRNEE